MAKYLDWGGLLTLWTKIKSYVSSYAYIVKDGSLDKIYIGPSNIVPVEKVNAGAGLNTTSNDCAVDGGHIGEDNNSGTLHLTKSGVTAGSYGPSTNATPSAGTTFDVPQVTVDKYGRVTGASTKTVTVPSAQTITLDGITGATINRYGACSTAANTAAKVVSVTNGTVPTLNSAAAGLKVTVKFTNANTADSPTLNVSGKGAKNIYHNGTLITTGENKALLAGICDFVYDGTLWHLVGNYMNTKVTSVDNHYEPSADNDSELTGTLSGTAGTYALNTEYTVLTGVKALRDSKGHVTGLTYTALKVKDTNTDTKNTAGSTNTTDKIYLVGAKSLAANPLTYSSLNVYALGGDLHSDTFNNISISRTDNTDNIHIGTSACSITVPNGENYTLGDACTKAVDTSIGGSNSDNLPTTNAVRNFVTNLMSTVAGALVYKGTITAESTLLNTALSKGYYYIVNMPNAQTTSVTIGGVECESGDMVIINTAGTYTTSNDLGAAIDVVQSNIAIITDAEINSLT